MWNHIIILFWWCTSVIYNKYVNFFGNFSHFVFLFCVTGKPLLPCYTNYYYYKSETENSDCVLLVLIEYLQKGHCKEHQQSQHVMSNVLAGTPRFRANKRCESHQKSQDISSSYFTFKSSPSPSSPSSLWKCCAKEKEGSVCAILNVWKRALKPRRYRGQVLSEVEISNQSLARGWGFNILRRVECWLPFTFSTRHPLNLQSEAHFLNLRTESARTWSQTGSDPHR